MKYTKDNIQGINFTVPAEQLTGYEGLNYLISKVAGERVTVSWEEDSKTEETTYTTEEVLSYLNSNAWVTIPGKEKTNAKLYLLLAFYGKEVTINKNDTALISGIKTHTKNNDNTTLSHEDKDSTVCLSFKGYAVNYKLSEIEITPSPEDHTDLHITIKTK